MFVQWSSWLLEQGSALTEGLRDFTDQLQEDTVEVRRETEEQARELKKKIEAQQLAQQMASLSSVGVQQVTNLSTAGVTHVAKGVERVGGEVRKLSAAVTSEGGTAAKAGAVLARGVDGLRRAADETDQMFAELLGAPSSAAAPPRKPPRPAPFASASGGPSGAASVGAGTQRLDERLRAMQSDQSVFVSPPADAAAFDRWSGSFELLAHTGQIEQLLKEKEALRSMHTALVPSRVTYRLFWQRYFYGVSVRRPAAWQPPRCDIPLPFPPFPPCLVPSPPPSFSSIPALPRT